MESAHNTIFTEKTNSPKVKALRLTATTLFLQMLKAQLQVMLWKAADQQTAPDEAADSTQFGWEIRDGDLLLLIRIHDLGSPSLCDVIHCECRAEGKKCSTEVWVCHKERLSCTSYCNSSGEYGCCNPYTKLRLETRRGLRWRMLKRGIWRMRVYTKRVGRSMILLILITWMMSWIT